MVSPSGAIHWGLFFLKKKKEFTNYFMNKLIVEETILHRVKKRGIKKKKN